MTAVATRHGSVWVRTFGPKPVEVVALHGFTLHGGMFEHLASHLDCGIAAPDLPGHGRTEIEPVTVGTAVDAIADVLATFVEPPLLLGYSQGGRLALQVALTTPERIGSLVLVSTSPGLSERARLLRQAADDGLANRIEQLGTERFITEWLAKPLVATDHVDAELRRTDRALRLENDAAGLAAALRGMGQASVADASNRIAGLQIPTRFVAGQGDQTYCEHAAAMAALLGERPVLVRGAGHNVVLEAPEAVAAVVEDLLAAG